MEAAHDTLETGWESVLMEVVHPLSEMLGTEVLQVLD
jgi:hypothetical protein